MYLLDGYGSGNYVQDGEAAETRESQQSHRWPQKAHQPPPPCAGKTGDFGLVNTVPHILEMAKQKGMFSLLSLGEVTMGTMKGHFSSCKKN